MKKIIAIALAVLMLASLATVSFAATAGTSPVGQALYTLKINAGDKSKTETSEVTLNEPLTITAPDIEGYEFVDMVIEGDYTEAARTTKTYTTPTVTITPTGSVTVTINYKPVNNGGDHPFTPYTPTTHDESTTSPDTGVNVALIALIALMGTFGVAVATKKLFVK